MVAPPVIKGAARPIAGLAKRMIAQIKHSNQKSYIEHLIKTARPGQKTSGSSTQFEKVGGFKQAQKDFEALKPSYVKDVHKEHPTKTTLVGQLADGRNVIVRNHRKSNAPTLEIQNGTNDYTKFRYIE